MAPGEYLAGFEFKDLDSVTRESLAHWMQSESIQPDQCYLLEVTDIGVAAHLFGRDGEAHRVIVQVVGVWPPAHAWKSAQQQASTLRI